MNDFDERKVTEAWIEFEARREIEIVNKLDERNEFEGLKVAVGGSGFEPSNKFDG
jgi:hypothetical protein